MKSSASKYHNDQPISGDIDSPDLLDRTSFAEHMAQLLILQPHEDCLTVSLEGEWGYGKTSIINLIKKTCRKDSTKPIIVEYNPWLTGNADRLVEDFLVNFSAQLQIPDKPKEGLQAARELLSYSKLFSAIKYVPGAEPWASIVEGVLGSAGTAADEISKLKDLDLLDRKQKVKDVLTKLNKPIIVIIDDIDRLTPDEAFQMMRLIKAVADFPGTTFLLAFDPQYLSNVLQKHGIDKSDRYLDKVVQLRVPLPLITAEAIEALVNSELERLSDQPLTEHFDGDKERLASLYHNSVKYLIGNPRDLKRIFNHLRLALNQTDGNVCFADLFGLSVLNVKAPAIYQHLKESPAAYIGRNFGLQLEIAKQSEVVAKLKVERDDELSKCSKVARRHIENLLQALFPLIGSKDTSVANFDKLGRVASPERLYIALHYQVPAGYAADTDIAKFMSGSIDRDNYLQRSLNKKFVERLLDLLSQNAEKVNQEQVLGILESLSKVVVDSEYVREQENNNYQFFGSNAFLRIRWLTGKLINRLDDKRPVISSLFENETHLPITAEIMFRLMAQHGDIESEKSDKDEIWVDDQTYKTLKAKWVNLVEKSILDGHIFNSPFASHIYFMLRRANEVKAKELVSELISKKAIDKLVLLLGRAGSDSTNGPFTHITQEEYPEIQEFSELEKLAKSQLDSQELSPFLKACYLSITSREKYYLRDAKKAEKW